MSQGAKWALIEWRMAGGAFLGYALVGLGPCLAVFFTSIIQRPFLGLIALTR